MTEPIVNEVRLRGRVSRAPETRLLPSGDEIVVSRIVVPRPVDRSSRAEPGSRSVVDAVDLVAWRSGARRSLGAICVDDVIEVEGRLRRRFWRAPSGPASRCEVEVHRVRR